MWFINNFQLANHQIHSIVSAFPHSVIYIYMHVENMAKWFIDYFIQVHDGDTVGVSLFVGRGLGWFGVFEVMVWDDGGEKIFFEVSILRLFTRFAVVSVDGIELGDCE